MVLVVVLVIVVVAVVVVVWMVVVAVVVVVASVARLMTGHRIARDFESLGEEWYHSNASPYATQRRKQKDET